MSSLSEDGNLNRKLRELAEAARREPSGNVEVRVRQAYRAHLRKRKNRAIRIYAVAVLAACLVLAVLLTRRSAHRRPASYANNAEVFIALPYGQSEVPIEAGVVVRVNLSPAEVRALGLPMDGLPAHPGPADLLIAQDGVARAIRLVDTNTKQ